MTTKTKILDAAEALFADFGFAGTSLRAITQRAEVNLASVNYHFGSKESLVQSVLQRKSAPLNETRINRLQQVLDAGNPGLEDLLTAFVSPALELTETAGGERYIKLLARIALEPEGTLREGLNAQYEAVMDFFMPPLREHLPDLDGEVLLWRIHFVLGTLGYCMAGSDAVLLKSQSDLFDRTNAETMIHRLVEFIAAGLRAPQVDVA